MKKMLILFLFLANYGFAQSPLRTSIDFSVENISIKDALNQLAELAGTDIAFSSNFFKKSAPISADFQQASLESILVYLLRDTNIDYKLSGKRVLLFRKKESSYTLSGYIEDSDSGEHLISATVYCPSLQRGTVTNEYGFYSLQLPAGENELSFSYLGYAESIQQLQLNENIRQNIQLSPTLTLAEVVVTPTKGSNIAATSDEQHDFYPNHKKMLELSPSLGGASDPIRTAQLLPGIQSGPDGTSGLFVRGGNNGHNLMLLDGVPVYIPYHMMGLFSVYNQHTVRSAKIFKGSFPARYGGRLSSVFDVRTREGNQYKWQGMAEGNLVNMSALVEGPIQKGKSSILVAGRASHSSFLLRPFLKQTYFNSESEDIDIGFYGVNVKLNYSLSDKDRLYLSHYSGRDVMGSSSEEVVEGIETEKVELLWGNSVTALRWNHLYHHKLFSNTTLTHSFFGYEYATFSKFQEEEDSDEIEAQVLDMFSTNNEIGLKTDFDYLANARHRLRFGGGVALRSFRPELIYLEGEDIESDILDELDLDDFEATYRDAATFEATEAHLYLEDHISLNPNWQVEAGLRWSSFLSNERNYSRLEPRLMTSYRLNEQFALRTSASRMIQYLHLVSYNNIRLPNDLWIPSDADLLPEEAWQAEVGLTFSLNTQTSISLDGYVKTLDNLYTYPEGFEFDEEEFEQFLVSGGGEVQGIEFALKHNGTSTGGLLSYAYTQSTRQFEDINDGAAFAYAHNHPHQLKLFLYRTLTRHLNVSMNWVFFSASPILNLAPLDNLVDGLDAPDTPIDVLGNTDYHRLDVNARYRWGNRFEHSLQLGAYNLYDRRNIAYYRLDLNEERYEEVYSLPFRLSAAYRFRF